MANCITLNQTSYHGAGAIQNIPAEVTAHGFKKAFVCCGPNILKRGVTAKVTDLLDEAGMAYEIFSDIKANPTIENVQNGVEAFKASGADYIIAIGGGSPMDTAKAIGIIINNPEFADVRSLEGVAPTTKPSVPIIAVPTTAGTAAEVTINYVIKDDEKQRKFVCVDTKDIPIVAIVDPDMMSGMPYGLTAATGMDALTHAIEGYITKAAWEMTDMFHIKAIEIISRSLRAACENDPKRGKTWLSDNILPDRDSPMSDWVSYIPWRTLWEQCMIHRTAWPMRSCCRLSWHTMPTPQEPNIKTSPSPWAWKALKI